MSFLRRLLGGGEAADEAPPPTTGAPAGPIAVTDRHATLTEQVGNLLARPELEFLIVLWDERRNLSVQFAPAAGDLLGEVTGDRYLEPRHRLREPQRSALTALGWHEDSTGGNWERTWGAGTDASAIAADVVAAMDVYGAPPRADWTITFGAD